MYPTLVGDRTIGYQRRERTTLQDRHGLLTHPTRSRSHCYNGLVSVIKAKAMETKGKTIRGKMKTNEVSHKPSETKQAIDNPLVDIAGKFGGEFWRETQLEMERCRKTDREETNKLLASKLDKQN